jgi:hypothetical protein
VKDGNAELVRTRDLLDLGEPTVVRRRRDGEKGKVVLGILRLQPARFELQPGDGPASVRRDAVVVAGGEHHSAVQPCWVLDAFANSAPTSGTPLVMLDVGIRLLPAILAVDDARRRIANATAGNPSVSTATAAMVTTFPENMGTSMDPCS